MSFIVEEKERAVCSALIVLWMACNCSVALPRGALGCLQCVIVICPENTHFLLILWTKNQTYIVVVSVGC